MSYRNDSLAAVLESERQRLGERSGPAAYTDPEGGYPHWDIGDDIDDAYDDFTGEQML
mgnify:CR=1 FL=1